MAPKPTLTTPKCFLLLLIIILSLLAFYLTSTLHYSSPKYPLPHFNVDFSSNLQTNVKTLPSWYKVLANEFLDRRMRVGLVNVKLGGELQSEKNVDIVNVKFEPVSKQIEWDHLFPEWIFEDNISNSSHNCPSIPIPILDKYEELDVVVARVPCGAKTTRDVYRLQVNLVVANLLVRCGWDKRDVHKTVYAVFIGECGPMFEIFRCNDLLWHKEDVRLYKPDLRKLKQKVVMPVGSCQIAPPYAEPGNEKWRMNTAHKTKGQRQREAYVTVLHSSETYVCGAIVLAQSIKQHNTTKDLVLLVDYSSVSSKSLRALRSAGWKVKRIERIGNPHAKKDAYNKWNYTKLRIWEKLLEYEKVMFIDSDVVLLDYMDRFFFYPELSAAKNDGHLFNSGVMIVEPSHCTFQALMEKRYEVVSYNGGDQGFLNEMFAWWHRLPMKANRLKVFAYNNNSNNDQRKLPEKLYAIHYLGLKPWTCRDKDYDCNWEKREYHRYASDSVHQKWWRVYNNMPKGLQNYCKHLRSHHVSTGSGRIRKWRGSKAAAYKN